MSGLLSGMWDVLASSWRASRRRLLVSAVLMAVGSISGPLVALFLAASTNAIQRHDLRLAVLAAGAVALTALCALTMDHFAHIFFFELKDMHTLRVEQEIGDLAQGTLGLQQHERRDFADRLELVRKEGGSIGQAVQTVLSTGTLLVQITLTAVLLARVEPWLLLLPAFAAPPLVAGRWADRLRERAELAASEQARLGWHLTELAVSPTAAKEVRLFGLQATLRQRQASARRGVERRLHRAETWALLLRLGGQLAFAVGYVGAVVLVVRTAITGQQSVGDVVLVITLAVQTNAQAASAVAIAKDLQRNGRTMSWLRWLRTEAESGGAVSGELSPPPTMRRGIDLLEVAFRYPNAHRDVLRDVTVHIPAGSAVAVVGDNGAGKSTLVKLLCRFYEPTSGQIMVDGVPLSAIDPQLWRARLAAGFQDFVRFDAPARRSVGLGDLPRADDDTAVRAAVRRADADAIVDGLPDGLDTHLGQAYEEGIELSGGQWQRIALSRAMMREGPLLLLLDEPSSALDPLAEHAILERYAASARALGGRYGGITVLISHRLSAVRMADLILVVSDGRIAESGSHQELMTLGGTYAELFSLQSSAYR
ncbi:ABC transporter ATP-binding protein [Actinoplanes sp. NPDC051346]|uniref:ABC transporter ATP-binding protein n=1 Tax=Actinoplanes sp. NPDC051346 TaxID=3155048 RepID=UPI0034361B82